MGRHQDCYPRLPDDKDHNTISRYHCLLDINPPQIRVRDFGSRNGTYVNDQKIRQRDDNIPQPLADIIDLALQDQGELYFKDAISFKESLLKVCDRF